MRFALTLVLLLALSAPAATYYVRTDGADTNDGLADAADAGGTSGQAWLTIGKAANTMVAGDTVRVQSGTYNERIAETTDGSAGNFITYMAEPGETVICRGFDLTGTSYIRIIGFEITHIASTYSRAITMSGACDHVEILDNYIHNTYGDQAIQGMAGAAVSYVTIRGNYINEVRWVDGVEINCERQAIGSDNVSHHWLVEYNHISRSGDFINLYGTNHIARNNYMHDYADAYCPVAHGHTHSDMFQPGSDGYNAASKNHVYERNFMGDSIEANSHVILLQDNQHATTGVDTNFLIRGNVAFNIGDGFCGGFGTDKISMYDNSVYDMSHATAGSIVFFNNTTSGSLDVRVWNMVIQDYNIASINIQVLAAGTLTAANNIGHQAGAHASYVSTSDPLYVNPASGTRNFRLQASSPAINAGKADIITITTASGSGTSFDVNDGQLLCDGFGIAEGDVVTINATTTRVTGISGNTVTVAASVSWTQNDPIFWGTDNDPDIGALPYGSTALTAATISTNGTTYTVTVTGDARGVWFYTNGIPSHFDYETPYQATLDYAVTAKAYALYAQETSVVDATGDAPPGGGATFNVTGTVRVGTLRAYKNDEE